MENLKAKLVTELRKIAGVEDRPSPVSGGTALFYHDKAFAHFHNDNELDLRLTRKNIKALGLSHPAGSIHHPDRSANSAWIEVQFGNSAHIGKVCELVRLALAELPAPKV
jgi:hypothetical protein